LLELAILLALVGVYGVTSFVVSRRTREIGIRVALGASRGTAMWLILTLGLFGSGIDVIIAASCGWFAMSDGTAAHAPTSPTRC